MPNQRARWDDLFVLGVLAADAPRVARAAADAGRPLLLVRNGQTRLFLLSRDPSDAARCCLEPTE